MTHIKVFKTDITDRPTADSIRLDIQSHIGNCDVSFDLEDCDNVLRVENLNGPVDESALKNIFKKYGYSIEPLT